MRIKDTEFHLCEPLCVAFTQSGKLLDKMTIDNAIDLSSAEKFISKYVEKGAVVYDCYSEELLGVSADTEAKCGSWEAVDERFLYSDEFNVDQDVFEGRCSVYDLSESDGGYWRDVDDYEAPTRYWGADYLENNSCEKRRKVWIDVDYDEYTGEAVIELA